MLYTFAPPLLRLFSITLILSLIASAIATAQTPTTWQATASNTWSTAGNWTAGVPGATNIATFSTAGATQFVTNNDLTGLTIAGLAVNNTAPQPFTIDGNAFTIGSASGIDMSTAAQNMTINAGVALGVTQAWNVAAGRILTMNGVISGSGGLTVPGAGIVRITSPGVVDYSSYSGGTTITGILEVGWTAATPENNLRIPPTGNSVLGTGPITVNGGELRLTPLDSATAPLLDGFTNRTVDFGPNGGLITLNGRVNNGRIPITTTAGATGTAVIRATAFNSNNWGTTNGFVLDNANSIQGTGPVRFEMLDGALTTFTTAMTINAPVTFQGVDNGSAAANRTAITVPGDVNTNPDARTVGRMGVANATTVTFAAGLTYRNAVQVTTMNDAAGIDGDITLAATPNGTFVAFQGRGTGTAVSPLTLGGATANTRTLTIETGSTAVLDARFRQDSVTIAGVNLNSRSVISPGGTLHFSQSRTTSTGGTPITGFHLVNGNIRGLGNDTADARVVTLLPNKTADGGDIGGVNWTASTANLEVNGTGTGGLRIEGASANLFPNFLSTARLQGVTGTGGTLTIAPSDNGSTISAAPTAASAVRLGVGSSGAGIVTVTVGAAANDLANWGGLVVKGSSAGGGTIATLGANQTFSQTAVIGGTLNIPSGRTLTSPVTLSTGGALAGTGTVAGTVAVNSGGVVAPADAGTIGQINVGGSTFAGGGRYNFEFNSLTPAPGTANDFVNGTGALDITASSATPFLIDIRGVNVPAAGTSPVGYTIATFAGGITNFAATSFAFVPTGWFTGTPTIAQQGNSLILTFTPVPEPIGILALGAGALGLAGWLRRKTS